MEFSLEDIETRQVTLDSDCERDDVEALQKMLDEVTFLRQEALRDFSAHELKEDRAGHLPFPTGALCWNRNAGVLDRPPSLQNHGRNARNRIQNGPGSRIRRLGRADAFACVWRAVASINAHNSPRYPQRPCEISQAPEVRGGRIVSACITGNVTSGVAECSGATG